MCWLDFSWYSSGLAIFLHGILESLAFHLSLKTTAGVSRRCLCCHDERYSPRGQGGGYEVGEAWGSDWRFVGDFKNKKGRF